MLRIDLYLETTIEDLQIMLRKVENYEGSVVVVYIGSKIELNTAKRVFNDPRVEFHRS